MHCSAQATWTEYHRLGSFKLKAGKSKIFVPDDLSKFCLKFRVWASIQEKVSLPVLQIAAFSLCPHMPFLSVYIRRERERSSFKATNPTDQDPIFTASFNLNYLLIALTLNIITLGIKASTYEFWENTSQSTASLSLVTRPYYKYFTYYRLFNALKDSMN